MRKEKFGRQLQKDLGELMSQHRNEWLTGAFVTLTEVVVSPCILEQESYPFLLFK